MELIDQRVGKSQSNLRYFLCKLNLARNGNCDCEAQVIDMDSK